MKIISKIMAFFRYRNEDAQLKVTAAEIKQGEVFLHPVDDEDHVICMKTGSVDIIINPHENISEADIQILEVKKITEKSSDKEQAPDKKKEEPKTADRKPRTDRSSSRSGHQQYEVPPLSYYMPKMRTVSFTVYEDEYDNLMNGIKANGYRKTEFLLACVSAAKKNSMEATYKKYTAEHKARRIADRQAAKIAQAEDLARNKDHFEAIS